MSAPTIFVPFANLSFNSGKLNSSGLVQADGVIHNGAGYLPPPPLFVPTDGDFTALDDSIDDPTFGHVNLNKTTNGDATIYLYSDGQLFRVDISGAPPWTITACGTVNELEAEEGSFVSFGPNEIFAGGHGNHVQIRRDGQANFEACFTSVDKPKAKFAAAIGARMLFGNIDNTGTAGDPDPNYSLAWWGATDDPRVIGNPDSHPQENTDFQPLNDDYGDIVGISNGKRTASIFKRRAVYQMDLGGIFGFEFDKVSTRYGCKFTRSICELADDDYFWSDPGPAVVRASQVMLLGDGFWTVRGLGSESPPDMELTVLSSAVDEENGLVFWLLRYQGFDYTYSAASEPPTETIGTAATVYALLCYNPVSNQFSFVWRKRADAGIPIVPESAPSSPVNYRPICLIDRIPWNNRIQMAGVGLLAVASGGDPRLFLTGLSGSSYTPEHTIGQDATFTTGLIPIQNPESVAIQGIRPVIRARRGRSLPLMTVKVKTCRFPWSVERENGPYLSTSNLEARNGWIATTGAAADAFVSIELTIAARTAGSPVSYAYLLDEIEGVEIQFMSKQGSRRG